MEDMIHKYVKKPENIRQIGESPYSGPIYIEDYVMTYIRQIFKEQSEEKIILMLGKEGEELAKGSTFIYGAIGVDFNVTDAVTDISEKDWSEAYEKIYKYFPGVTVMGWVCGVYMWNSKVDATINIIQRKYFSKESNILFLFDLSECEEKIFKWKDGNLKEQTGYYIYYEKNPQMQAYMLEKNPELNQPEQELVADDAVKTFRKIIQKKHTEETQETEERASVFSYAATACLVLAVLTVGVQFYQNYNHKSITDTITDTVSRTANSTEVTKAERQTEKKSVTPTSALKKDLTPIPVSPAATETPPVTSMAAEDNAETDTKNVLNSEKEQEIYREESDTRKAERRVKQEQVENNAAKNKISEDVTDSAVASSAEAGTSYVIKPGDTLYQISISRYGTMEKVADICRANGLTEEEIIYPGQIIVLP